MRTLAALTFVFLISGCTTVFFQPSGTIYETPGQYGIDYQPRLRPDGRQMIATLERTASGAEFDKVFLQLFSRHHFAALGPTVQCLTGADVMHDDLERYCRGIEEAQTMDIDDMRHTLCERFANCDYQPFNANELTWEQE